METKIDAEVVTKLTHHIISMIGDVKSEIGREPKLSEVIHAFGYYLFWSGSAVEAEKAMKKSVNSMVSVAGMPAG